MSIRTSVRAAVWNDTERRLRSPWRLLASVALLFLGILVLQFAVIVAVIVSGFSTVLFEGFFGFVVLTLATAPVVIAGLWVVARFVDRRRFTDYGLRVDRRWLADLGFGLALGAALQTAVFLFGWSVGWFRVTGVFVAEGSFLLTMGGLLALFVAVGVYEELLARGWLLTNLAEGLRFVGERGAVSGAVLVSSVVFGVLHLGNPGASVLSAAVISAAGVFLALGYVLTGELAIPIGVHVTWNFFQGPVFGLGVSGISMPASVIATEPVGPEIATGGAFGPEAGALGIVAIAVGIVATVLWVWLLDGRVSVHPRLVVPQLRHRPNADETSRQ